MLPITPSSHAVFQYLPEYVRDIRVNNIGYDDFHITAPLLVFRVQGEYTLHYVLHGAGHVCVEGQEQKVGRGSLFLIRPGETFRYFPDKENPWDYVWFGFDGGLAEQCAALLGFGKGMPPVKKAANPQGIEQSLRAYFAKGATDAMDAIALFWQVLALEKALTLSSRLTAVTHYAKAEELLRLNYRSPDFTVGVLAEMMHLSPAYLSRLYQKEGGLSPVKRLIGLRLSFAAKLLEESTMSVRDVAEACGYRDEIRFTKAFGQTYGLSPRAYRKRKDKTT